MSQFIKEEIEKFKEKREKILEEFKVLFSYEPNPKKIFSRRFVGYLDNHEIIEITTGYADFISRNLYSSQRYKRRKLKKELLDIYTYQKDNNKHSKEFRIFSKDCKVVVDLPEKEFNVVLNRLSLIKKYVSSYKDHLENIKIEKLKNEYIKLTGKDIIGGEECSVCGEVFREDAVYCCKCGHRKSDVNNPITKEEWKRIDISKETKGICSHCIHIGIGYFGGGGYCRKGVVSSKGLEEREIISCSKFSEKKERIECKDCRWFVQVKKTVIGIGNIGIGKNSEVILGFCNHIGSSHNKGDMITQNLYNEKDIIDDCNYFWRKDKNSFL